MLGRSSNPSNVVCGVTPISNLVGSAVSTSQIKLRFRGSLDVTYSLIGPGGRVNGIHANQDGSTRVAITVSGLPRNTRTCWRIIAVASNGQESVQSSQVCVRTKSR